MFYKADHCAVIKDRMIWKAASAASVHDGAAINISVFSGAAHRIRGGTIPPKQEL